MDLGKLLRARRESLGLTQLDVAKAIGSKPAYISHLETGIREPSFSTLNRLAAALGWEVRFTPARRRSTP